MRAVLQRPKRWVAAPPALPTGNSTYDRATETLTFSTTAVPTTPPFVSIQYTITITDKTVDGLTSFANDGRVIVVTGAPGGPVGVVSDTGSQGAEIPGGVFLDATQITGTIENWSVVVGPLNDLAVIGVNSSMVTELQVTDSAALTLTNPSI